MCKNLQSFLLCAFALLSTAVFAQNRTVSGTVTSAGDGMPLPGVSVVVQGTTVGATTDFDGKYSIEVSGDAVLEFSYLGFADKSVTVGSQSVINVSLTEDAEQLGEVVVTALGVSREKKALGYAVTELNNEDLNTTKDPNVVNSLSGKVAGVVITQSTSGPGGGSRVVIRGNNSITGNNQPLYVVDGIPIDNSGVGSAAGSSTSEYSRADYGTGISDINPEDIETMTVLKGPNAAALYGSRASNGVILITTKKGTSGRGLGVAISSSATFENPLLLPEYQNEYGRGSEGNFPQIPTAGSFEEQVNAVKSANSWGPAFDGSSQFYYTGENRPYVAQPDNVKDFFKTGTTFTNAITLTGGDEKSNVLFSYTNTDASSILPNSDIKRHNFNLRGYSKLTDKLTLDAKVTYFTQDATNRALQGTEGVLAWVYTMPRNVMLDDLKRYQDLENPVNPDNPYASISWNSTGGNPYWMQLHDVNEDSRHRVNGFAKVDYAFTDWLSAFVRVGTDQVKHDTYSANQYGHHYQPQGALSITENTFGETNVDFLLTANKNITEKLNLNASFGGNHSYRTYKQIGINGRGFKIPTRVTVSNLVDPMQTYTPLQEKKVNSLYGAFSFAYDNYLYLDFTGRNDWSSTLSPDNRSYFYPSASVSFIPSTAFDFQDGLFNFLKLRASWAQVGNDTGVYQLYDTFELASNGYLGLTQIGRRSVKANEDLKPESVTSLEFGVEFRMLQDRLFFDASYYSIESEDLIFDVPVPESTGYNFFRENVGRMTNKGFELLIGGTPVKTDKFEWEVSANIAKNTNKLEELIDDLESFTFSSSNGGNIAVQATVGGEFGEIWGRDYKRVPEGPNAGALLLDANGRPQGTDELVKLGNYQPDMTGGLTNNLKFGNLGLRFLVDFRLGGEIYSGTDASLDGAGVSTRTLEYREDGVVVDGFIEDGAGGYVANTSNITAQQYWGSVSGISSNYVYDQTNVRMREVALTYNFPSKLLDNTFINSASISLIGRNLFFFYKEIDNFDPESSYSTSNFAQGVLYNNLPTTRSLGFNLNLKF
ncbi:SusC/RagA family TonB-linked outer membrane protein [Robertkochia solimangrovi]|uniref:SusC/RagA family TonB-linked outer membrane protein n=1 Tax=Robertkochia solimangrovi TaxID=2213046 RepID=UPI0011810EE0|nr:SusC/RagA family TonB-linked outer membrane protein [Robertkochia solimangrovi]TRZ44438.1 SusC/RagA family TonB-linked outer membrane protein [Robertkochia solimangrovi]